MAKALTLAFIAPLITTALSPFLLNEKVGLKRWSAVIVGFLGSLIVIQPGFMEFNLATIAGLGTGFFYGLYLIVTRKLHTSDNSLLTLLLTGVVGLIIGSFIAPFVWINLSLKQWLLLALMGIFACLGHFFLILSLKYADASKLAPFGYFEIVTNVILGFYFFGDFPDYWSWVGLLIIISSGIYISFREQKLVK
jgi:drug/metabolite transporter (DMT)-like permease